MKSFLRNLLHAMRLGVALLWYAATGRNMSGTLQSLIALHSLSNGRTTAFLAKWVGHRPLPELRRVAAGSAGSLVFPGMDRASIGRTLDQVSAKGYCVCPARLAPATCSGLVRFAQTAPGDEWNAAGPTSRRATLGELAPDAAKLQFDANRLITLPEVQDLVADIGLLGFLQDYFGHMPVFDSVGMWWSIASDRPASSEVAQMFHFDLDRLRWLKLFVYLTDVTPDTGPHVFVEGSHRPEGHRAELLRRGYVRINDDEIDSLYGKDKVREICGPAGTMLIVDTKGMHKGKPPKSANRLILELQFSSSIFGTDYPMVVLPKVVAPSLQRLLTSCPEIYRQLVPG